MVFEVGKGLEENKRGALAERGLGADKLVLEEQSAEMSNMMKKE